MSTIRKLYAKIYPVVTVVGDGFNAVSELFLFPYHKMKYENICGYSLGHTPKFFNTLEEAKNKCGNNQHAIVEMELGSNNEITKFNTLYTLNGRSSSYMKVIPDSDGRVGTYIIPGWDKKEIRLSDVSAHALNAINSQYKASTLYQTNNDPIEDLPARTLSK